MTAVPAPLALHAETVRPEWLDYNGHMNVAYYVLAFDHATDALLDHLALGAAYRALTDRSVFVAEAHVTYRRELGVGEAMRFTTQVLGADAKRLHVFHRLWREDELAATNELMLIHVDLSTHRAAPWPEPQASAVATLAAVHAALPRPPETGRAIGLSQTRPASGGRR